MTLTDQSIALIKQFEGLRLAAYPDPASGGDPWTVGYGATGAGIGPGTVWPKDLAEADLLDRVDKLIAEVDDLLSVTLPGPCLVALTSFAYNVGIHALSESTLLRLINAGHPRAAADEFGKWVHASGHVPPGLVTRRAKEREVFLSGLAGPPTV